MPYKNQAKQKAAQARYFQENRDRLREAQNSRRSLMRRRAHEIKALTPCKDCGETFPHYIMQFDHLPQFEKAFNVSMISRCPSMEALMEEIAKCDVVCSNCHAHRTFMRKRSRKESSPLIPKDALG